MHFSPWVDMEVVGETYQAQPSRHSENNTQNKEDIVKLTIIAATGGVGRQGLRPGPAARHPVTPRAPTPPHPPPRVPPPPTPRGGARAAGPARVAPAALASSGAQALEPAVAGAGDSTRCSTFR